MTKLNNSGFFAILRTPLKLLKKSQENGKIVIDRTFISFAQNATFVYLLVVHADIYAYLSRGVNITHPPITMIKTTSKLIVK